MIPVILDYADETDYSFDPYFVKVDPITRATLAKLPNFNSENFYASIKENYDADRETQTSTAIPVGTSTLTSITPINVGAVESQYIAAITEAANDIAIYSGNTINELGNELCVRFKFVPIYDQAPSAGRYIFTLTESLGSLNGLLGLQHLPDGKFYIRSYSSTGALKFSGSSPLPHPLNQNQEYEIEFNFSMANGSVTIFLDGLQIIDYSFAANSFTRAPASQSIIIGSYYGATFPSIGGYFRDIQLFTVAQHFSGDDYSSEVPRIIPIYLVGGALIENTASILADGLSDYMDMTTTPANTEVTYILKFKGEKYYWDGSVWAISNCTLAQSNTITEIDDNVLEDFGLDGGTLSMLALLTSHDGLNTPTLTELSFLYSFHGVEGVTAQSIIFGNILQDEGRPLTSATLTFTSKPYFINGNLITVNEAITVNQTTGYFEIILPEMTEVSGGKVKVKMKDEEGKNHTYSKSIRVTNAASSRLEDIIL